MKPAERIDLNLDDEYSSRFLKLLDPRASGFTFQTFDDDRARKILRLPGLFSHRRRRVMSW